MKSKTFYICIILTLLISYSIQETIFLQDLTKDTGACPTFICENNTNKDNLCFSGTGKIEDGDRKTTLNKCAANSYCDIKDFFKEDNKTCTKPKSEEKVLKEGNKPYPGEECFEIFGTSTCENVKITKSGSDEVVEQNKCTKGICEGNKLGEKCYSMSSCVVGTYCDGYDIDQKVLGICKYYKKDGDICSNTAECGFKSYCGTIMSGDDKDKKKCIKRNSLKLGTEVAKNEDYLCESATSGKDTDDKYKCALIVYDTDKPLVNDEVVECQYDTYCNYKYRFSDAVDKDVKDEKLKKKCQCSFDGKGYCPFANGNMKNRFYYINKARSYVEASESTIHNLHRNAEVIQSASYIQYSSSCREFYGSALSYKSGICPSVTNNYVFCTYINSSNLNVSLFIIFMIIGFIFN